MIETYMWIVWLALFVIMIVIEAASPELVSIWFAAGALVSLIVSLIPSTDWWVEVIIFVVISLVAVLCLRPLVKRYLRSGEIIKTNVDSLIGREDMLFKTLPFKTWCGQNQRC